MAEMRKEPDTGGRSSEPGRVQARRGAVRQPSAELSGEEPDVPPALRAQRGRLPARSASTGVVPRMRLFVPGRQALFYDFIT